MRGQGSVYQGKYQLTLTNAGLWLDKGPGTLDTAILCSPSPRELDITSLGYHTGTVLQAIS